jgi:hypothetical protein
MLSVCLVKFGEEYGNLIQKDGFFYLLIKQERHQLDHEIGDRLYNPKRQFEKMFEAGRLDVGDDENKSADARRERMPLRWFCYGGRKSVWKKCESGSIVWWLYRCEPQGSRTST